MPIPAQAIPGLKMAITTLIEDVNATRYITYATFCLLIYDHGSYNLSLSAAPSKRSADSYLSYLHLSFSFTVPSSHILRRDSSCLAVTVHQPRQSPIRIQ